MRGSGVSWGWREMKEAKVARGSQERAPSPACGIWGFHVTLEEALMREVPGKFDVYWFSLVSVFFSRRSYSSNSKQGRRSSLK
jgi:hypothetical protein